MRKISLIPLIGVLLTYTVVFAEVTAKTVLKSDGILVKVFYSKDKEIAKEVLGKPGEVIKTTGKIPDGIVKEYYDNGKLMAKYNYKNSKLEGVSKWYYENGSLRGERNYKEGKQDGISKFYYVSGSLGGTWNYKDGNLEGMTILYWGSGNVKAEHNYKNNKREGINRQYYETGELRYIYTYKKGKKINRKGYSRDGELKRSTDY